MNTALMILNPREIPDCMEALASLPVAKCWIQYMPERQAAWAINEAIKATSFDRYVVISDDTRPTPEALAAVLALHDENTDLCVTGYCQLAADTPLMNLTTNVLPPPPPLVTSYAFMTKDEVEEYEVIDTTFAGLALTCMTRELWLDHPLEVSEFGGQMDYVLSYNLAQSGIGIISPRDGFVFHVKERWNQLDEAPQKRLLIGAKPQAVRWTDVPDDIEVPEDEVGENKQPPRHVQAPRGERIVALLSFFNEPIKVLTGCLTRMAAAGVDHVVAMDGRYKLYPGKEHMSPGDQLGSIVLVCAKLGMGVTLHIPPYPWESEVEKRTSLFTTALGVSDPGDWFFVIDADELVATVPSNFRERLKHAEEDVGLVVMRDMEAARVKKPDFFPEWFTRRSLFRAQPIIVMQNHHTYVNPLDGRELWNAKPEMGQAVPALDLTGGKFTPDGVALPDFENPGAAVVVEHWAGSRGAQRLADKNVYYTRREEERIERGPCAWCKKAGIERQAARRVPSGWRQIKGMEKPISDIEELCDEHAAVADRQNRDRLRSWGMLCSCVDVISNKDRKTGLCRSCGLPVELSAVQVIERNGRPAIL
jgi:hypothetical protein